MIILGIETSCDETSAAVVLANKNDSKVKLLSNIVTTSLLLHVKTGGIIPEVAAREQIKYIIPTINEALQKAGRKLLDIDSIAVTTGPGLIGSLLVGVETAKTFAYLLDKPIISVNHLFGHIYANFIDDPNIKNEIEFPALALVVSGGHTDLVLLKKHQDIVWLGGTRDDAAGEAFDKIGRLLNLPYPAGPVVEKLSTKGDFKKYNFPRPLISSNDFDFSFSGLKTAVLREVKNKRLNNKQIADICASFQKAIIDTLVAKTIKAAVRYGAKSILLGGGVSANYELRQDLIAKALEKLPNTLVFVPAKNLCTDNAAMICAAAFFNHNQTSWQDVDANPQSYFI
ncbi:MAG: tRNA (adenosine(37)-N6)-threonylcarbamoyltransferase complex transferase subunit TsaD [Candidatus Levybacteria bacterium]|nr:tRNA (adenosine(37)-N6)-threonylcarbamoyltransferase complex transferase subunit TsaD [Candidatus Levybacteria bacterium]